jgi:hypothetical protein
MPDDRFNVPIKAPTGNAVATTGQSNSLISRGLAAIKTGEKRSLIRNEVASLLSLERIMPDINFYTKRIKEILDLEVSRYDRERVENLEVEINNLKGVRVIPQYSCFIRLEGIYDEEVYFIEYLSKNGGNEFDILEALKFDLSEDSLISALFLAVLLPTRVLFPKGRERHWSWRYANSGNILLSDERLSDLLDNKTFDIDRSTLTPQTIRATPLGLRVKRDEEHDELVCSCLCYNEDGTIVDNQLVVRDDGRLSEVSSEYLLPLKGRYY